MYLKWLTFVSSETYVNYSGVDVVHNIWSIAITELQFEPDTSLMFSNGVCYNQALGAEMHLFHEFFFAL